MNPISLMVWTIEENYWVVFLVLVLCFCYFLYVDGQNRQLRPSLTNERKKHSRDRHEGADCGDADDEDPAVPALPIDTPHVSYQPPRLSDAELLERSRSFLDTMQRRRTVRMFSPEPVSDEAIENMIRTAGSAPSGAHTEPWTFVVVKDPKVKKAIRTIVEEEEDLNYSSRMSRQWVADLKPFRTKPVKPYLTEAPVLICVFRQTHSYRQDGKKRMHYYSEISVSIAAGILLAAIQYAGLVALTSTPLNSSARLSSLLQRPRHERLELLLPVGRPHPSATVPALARKPYEHIAVHV